MKTSKDIEVLLAKGIVQSDQATRQRIRSRLQEAWQRHDSRSRRRLVELYPWQIRLIVAASILLVVSLSLHLIDRAAQPVYALDQTIQAVNGIQDFHFQCRRTDTGDVDREAWVRYDPNGQLRCVRVNFYQQDSVVVWRDGVTQYWLKDSNEMGIFEDQQYSDKILFFAHRYDPKQAMGYLRGLEAKGDVHIVYQEQGSTRDPITFSVFYEPNTFVLGQKKPAMKEVFSIDPQTKLVEWVDVFTWLEAEGDYKKDTTWEYVDYNQPVAPDHFELMDEIPSDCKVLNTVGLNLGLEQGTWTDEHVAQALVEQFLEAWRDNHLNLALQYCGCTLPRAEQRIRNTLSRVSIDRIVTINTPPEPASPRPGLLVKCVLECSQNATQHLQQCVFHVREYTPGWWMIDAGFQFQDMNEP